MLKHNRIIRIINSINLYKLLISLILAVFVVIIGYERISLPARKPLPISVALSRETIASGSELGISRILLDGMEYNLALIPLTEGWEYREKLLLSTSLMPETITIELPEAKDIRIIFRNYEGDGIISISEGSQVVNLRLDNNYIYIAHTNVIGIFEVLPWLILVSILFMFIFYILVDIFCKAVYRFGGKKRDIILWGGITVYRICYYLMSTVNIYFSDSRDYISYDMKELFTEFKLFDRVPLYPIIIAGIRFVTGETLYLYYLVLLQIIVSAIAVVYFYKLVCIITENKNIAFVMTIFYACSPAVVGFDQCILSESLATSGTVFFLYFITSYIISNNTVYAIRTIFTAFVLTFLRPTFLMFFVLIAIFLVIQAFFIRKDIKALIKPFVALMFCSIFILVYIIRFNSIYGYYSISRMKVRQDLYVCIDQGFYKNSTDNEFIELVDEELGKYEPIVSVKRVNNGGIEWKVLFAVQEYYGNDDTRIMELVKEVKEDLRKEYVQYIMRIIKEHAEITYGGYNLFLVDADSVSYNIMYMLSEFWGILNFMHVYVLICVEGIFVVNCWKRKRKDLWIHVGFFVFMPAIMLGTFITTNAEFMRTSVSIVPFAYCSIAYCISRLVMKLKN